MAFWKLFCWNQLPGARLAWTNQFTNNSKCTDRTTEQWAADSSDNVVNHYEDLRVTSYSFHTLSFMHSFCKNINYSHFARTERSATPTTTLWLLCGAWTQRTWKHCASKTTKQEYKQYIDKKCGCFFSFFHLSTFCYWYIFMYALFTPSFN